MTQILQISIENRFSQIIYDETRLTQIYDDLFHLQMNRGHQFEFPLETRRHVSTINNLW